MKAKLFTILGALLIVSSSAVATEPANNQNVNGALGAGDKPDVCECNLSPAKLNDANTKQYNSLLLDDASSTGSPTGTTGVEGAK